MREVGSPEDVKFQFKMNFTDYHISKLYGSFKGALYCFGAFRFQIQVLTFWFKQIKKKKVHLVIQENLQE